MNYYPFHIGDYLSATRHLSWEEDAAYRRLLDTYYTTEKPLPTELRAVCRLVLATSECQREAVRVVLEEFFELTEAGWTNQRADKEIEAMREKQEKQRQKAKTMWEKRKAAEPAPDSGSASAMPRHAEHDAAASKPDANALPPTPTPTPTPTPVDKKPTASSPAKLPTCPVDDLIGLYHQILPNLPAVRLMTEGRKKAVRKLWDWVLTSKRPDHTPRATNADEALAWFREYFTRATENDFLMGRTPRTGPHANWQCDLDFLLTERGLRHVIEKTQGGDTE